MIINEDITWGFPFHFNKNGRVSTLGGRSTVEPTSRQLMTSCGASLRQVLFTGPGERVMLPDYGVDSDSYVFDPIGSPMAFLYTDITSQVAAWSYRTEVSSVSAQVQDGSKIIVSLTMRHAKSNQAGEAQVVFG
jgi:phage baseplate assembly protein W